MTLDESFANLDEAAQAAELSRLVDRRIDTVSRSIRSHIDGVLREANGGETGEDVSWFTYFVPPVAHCE